MKKFVKCILAATSLAIAISLTLSIIHSHDHINWNDFDFKTDLEYQFTTNSQFCPICGYILKTDFSDKSGIQTYFEKTSNLVEHFNAYDGTVLLILEHKRAPPING